MTSTRIFETAIQRRKRMMIIESLEEVIDVPREYWEIKRSKKSQEVMIRQIYIYLLSTLIGYELIKIAEICGVKAHSTIIKNIATGEAWASSSELYPYQNQIIKETIKLYEQRNS